MNTRIKLRFRDTERLDTPDVIKTFHIESINITLGKLFVGVTATMSHYLKETVGFLKYVLCYSLKTPVGTVTLYLV